MTRVEWIKVVTTGRRNRTNASQCILVQINIGRPVHTEDLTLVRVVASPNSEQVYADEWRPILCVATWEKDEIVHSHVSRHNIIQGRS